MRAPAVGALALTVGVSTARSGARRDFICRHHQRSLHRSVMVWRPRLEENAMAPAVTRPSGALIIAPVVSEVRAPGAVGVHHVDLCQHYRCLRLVCAGRRDAPAIGRPDGVFLIVVEQVMSFESPELVGVHQPDSPARAVGSKNLGRNLIRSGRIGTTMSFGRRATRRGGRSPRR